MRALVSTLLALVCVLTLAAGAAGGQKRIPWLTFNEVSLNGEGRVLSSHDIFPAVSSLSPDRRRFAYVNYTCDGCARSNQLRVADVRGPGDRLLVEAPSGIDDLAWAPNGRTIAFDADGIRPPIGRTIAFDADGIWLVDADGTNLRRIADRAAGLSWSPDSRRLAFTRNTQLRSVMSVLSVDSGEERALGPGQLPRWSPNGRSLLFEYASGRIEPPKIRVVPVLGGSPRTVARGAYPSWSPDGKRISFVRYEDYTASLWIVSSRGGTPRRLATARAAADALWSPDSRRLAFQQSVRYCASKLSVVHISRGRPRALAAHTRGLRPLAWSSTGRKVLYAAERCSNQ